MNRNVESHFAKLPEVNIGRSMFDRSCRHITTGNAGQLIPIYVDEILPGDSVNMTISSVVRAQTLLAPIYDTCYLDTYAFFVPSRLTWSHFRDFFGENNQSAWVPTTEYKIPTISSPEGGFAVGSIADYMGIPTGITWSADADNAPSALPLRGYAIICDQWFRDQNVQDPLNIPLGDANQTGSNGTDYVTDVANGGMPFIANKFHDYFTSSLPSAQKGNPVGIPFTFDVPVVTKSDTFSVTGNPGLTFENALGETYRLASAPGYTLGNSSGSATSGNSTYNYNYGLRMVPRSSSSQIVPNNLYASGSSAGFTVNDLRLAFQMQKYYERLARSGSRYPEILLGQYGVVAPDASIQRPEYLGGTRIPLNVQQVSNNAQTDTDFLGDVGAMSVTSDVSDVISKSFTEPGYLYVLAVVRYDHTYGGLERFWTRHKLFDFYNPVFCNIGEQPVKQCEVHATSSNITSDVAFGFQEAWADYRYKPNRYSAEMKPGIPNSLASWHLGDYYTEPPTLSAGWMQEDKTNVDRVLAVTSAVSNQFLFDFYFKSTYTRPMPMYSVPGLIDHN